jgi:hypothetical protein
MIRFNIDGYMAVIALIAKKNQVNINTSNIREVLLDNTMLIQPGKTVSSTASGMRSNINTQCDYMDNDDIKIPYPVFEILQSVTSIKNENHIEFYFNSEIDIMNFEKWKVMTTINKLLYVNASGFVCSCITQLEERGVLSRSDSIGVDKELLNTDYGTIGPAARLYKFQETMFGPTETILNNKVYVHFDDVFDKQFNYRYNVIDNILSRVKKNQIIEKILMYKSHEEIHEELFEMLMNNRTTFILVNNIRFRDLFDEL